MKISAQLISIVWLFAATCASFAATTINSANRFAYGANLGWMDWRGDSATGAVIGEYVCAGYIYSANVGWINLGGGSPTNGIRYQNLSANDFGVNHDGLGNLRGYAYSANIGWVNFEDLGAPKVDLVTGKLSGSVYAANCGWISLSNAFGQVQTDTIAAGIDSDGDGMADAWELTYTNTLTAFSASSDSDQDGASDQNEYVAGTDPLNSNSKFQITAFNPSFTGAFTSLSWSSVPTRQYRVLRSLDLNSPLWLDSGLGIIAPDGATTTRAVADSHASTRYYRVEATRPLSP